MFVGFKINLKLKDSRPHRNK